MPDTDPSAGSGGTGTSGDDALRRALLALKDLRGRAERAERAATEPIAIIGIGCRFPAGANSPAEYWELLRDGRDAVGPIPDGRWDHRAFFDPDPDAAGTIYTDQGAFIDQPVDRFDASFFGIAPIEARSMDPQQRLLLEVTWEALEHAGVAADQLTGSSTGVFVGMSTFDYSSLVVRNGDPGDIGTYSGTGVAGSVAAGRLSYFLGVRGPAVSLDTACSSSLVALSLAAQSLRSGACRMALAGGVNLMLDPQAMVALSLLKALSPTGRCHTFAADADGYVRGEGCGVVVLKRLSDAQADGDRVLAVVRAAAVNHDGRSSGLTVPSGAAQREVIQRALTEAGLQPTDIDYVEAHGTGTDLGDPIEVRALDAVYSRGRPAGQPLLLGSAKTNIGHLEAAAGIAGVVKTVLALQHEELPPHLHCDEPSPHIDWATMPIEITRRLHPWARTERVRRAAVSAFGFSGTNAHVILEEAPAVAVPAAHSSRPVVLTLSARDDTALTTLAGETAEVVSAADVATADLAWTLQTGRARFRRRLAVTASSADDAAEMLRSWQLGADALGRAHGVASTRPRIAFVYTGQGAQLPRMGRDLYEHEPVFRAVLDECDEILAPHLPHRLLAVMHGDGEIAGLINQTQYTQPAMFALQCGLTSLWRSWGVVPDVVTGHSIGEYAAAVAAGVMDLPTAAAMIAARGALMGALPAGGAMVAVFADEQRVTPLIAAHSASVSIAAINGPSNVVVSGDGTAIDRIVADLDAAGIRHRRLEVSHAFHSPLMEAMVADFDARTRDVVLREPTVGFVSTVTGRAETAVLATPRYWRDQVLATVHFGAAVDSIGASGIDQFLEIGPQPTLLGMIARVRGNSDGLHASLRPAGADRAARGEPEQVADALGSLWVSGVEPNWTAISGGTGARVDAPTYPFQRESYWLPEPKHRPGGSGSHPLLGTTTTVPSLRATVHESVVATHSPVWLDDHRLAGTAVFPGSAYVEMALAAGAADDEIETLGIREALVLPEGSDVTVQTVVTGTGDRREVQISSVAAEAADGWKLHATATLRRRQDGDRDHDSIAAIELADTIASFDDELDVGRHYERLGDAGLTYGPAFRGVTRLLRRDGAALGHVVLPTGGADAKRYRFHPALLDACFHVLGAALTQTSDPVGDMFVPVAIDGVRVVRSGVAAAWCEVTLREQPAPGAAAIVASIRVYDEAGQGVAEIERLEARRTSRAVWERALGVSPVLDTLYEVAWRPVTRPDAASDSGADTSVVAGWLVVGDDPVAADALASRLAECGAGTAVVAPFDESEVSLRLDELASVAPDSQVGVVVLCATGATVGPESDPMAAAGGVLRLPLAVAQMLAARPAGDARLWLVTRGAQSVDGEPPDISAAAVWGLGRTIANEQAALACVCVDLDLVATDDAVGVAELAAELRAGGATSRPADDQVAIRGRRRLVARLARHDATDRALPAPYGLQLDGRGSLEQMSYVPRERCAPGPGEIEVEVRATGVNFRDVLNVLGMYPGEPGLPGLECAGVVTAIGKGVVDHAVGDAVLGIAPQAYDSHAVTPAALMVAKPAAISFAEAATLPIAYLTAAYGLSELADLQPGESVLIHAAAGGVGMAAVSIAQRIGAEIYATVGSAEKRRTMQALGVRHIYSSRTPDFAEQILADTGGRGVDVVLNSLSDEFIDRSFEALAPAGRFLEIGKRGVWTDEQAAVVRPHAEYHVYELADFLAVDPAGVRGALQRVADDVVAGTAAPLPLRAFPASGIRDAFRFMAQARHIGKVVITHRAAPAIRDDGAYVVTGGLGGLGLVVARWLVDAGARHLTLTGRSVPTPDAAAAVDDLRAAGTIVRVVQADIADAADVARVISTPGADGVPLRGVFHAAGVIDDGVLAQQSWSRFETVLGPKLIGAELLDAATHDADLDHFVLFSSVSSVLGAPGQANYAAANSALDAIAHRRRAEGRPALSINWGAWAEAGMAARLDAREHRRMAERGVCLLSTELALEALDLVLGTDAAQVGVLSVDWPTMLGRLDGGVPPLLTELAAAGRPHPGDTHDGSSASLVDALAGATPDQHHVVAAAFVTVHIMRVLGRAPGESVDAQQDLAELGMDSLMAVELANRLRSSTGLALEATVALEHPSVHALAAHLLQLLQLPGVGTAVPSTAGGPSVPAAVTRRSGAEIVMATSAQERILFVERLSPGRAVYNLPVVLRLAGALDDVALEAAVLDLVRRHEPLRTNFVLRTARHELHVQSPEAATVPFVRHDARDAGPTAVDQLLRDEFARAFDLACDTKVRALLVRTADDEHVFALTMHHLATDGWSMTRVLRDLIESFNARVDGRPSTLAPLPVDFTDYARWQEQVEHSAEHRKKLQYWTDVLGGTLPVLDLPADHQRPPVPTGSAGLVRLDLSAEQWAAVRGASRDAGVTPFVFLLASYIATLARWSGQDDFVVGTASANRSRPEIHELVGLFVNTVSIRAGVDQSRPFTALLDTVRSVTIGALAHDDVPFNRIVEAINPPRELSRSIIYQTTFVLVNVPMPDVELSGGIQVSAVESTSGAIEHDLDVRLTELDGRATGFVEYNADIFDAATVQRFVDHWMILLQGALRDPTSAVGALPLLSEGERDTLATWSSGPTVPLDGEARLEAFVASSAARRPDSIAVACGSDSVTYAALMARSHQLARAVIAAGVRPGDRVGVAVDRSVSMVVALLAVLEAGAAYVPLDPALPPDRLAFMVSDAELGVVVVSDDSLRDSVDTSSIAVVDVVIDAEHIATFESSPLARELAGRSDRAVAYVIYTSGSTGVPKGVEIEHRSVVNFVRSMIDQPGFTADDVMLAVTTLSFDIAVLELFVPLAAGGRVVIADRDDVIDGRRLAALVPETGATVMQATPTTWSMMIAAGWDGDDRLRVLCGGEAMPIELGRRLVERCGSLWNMFGPTETTIWSTLQRVHDRSLRGVNVPIGRPIANTVCRVLDSFGQLTPIGVPGELYIGGAGVARGYLHRPELTARRFVPDPFGELPTDRLYRTGDLARWLPDGTIEFLGRLDFQVKVRGHRIELGEIESALRSLPDIADAVVVAAGSAAAGRLVAYAIPTVVGLAPAVAEVRVALQQRLPDYMVPSLFMWLESFPLTPNRKIDRKALPDPGDAVGVSASFVEPRTDAERRIATIVADVLDLDRVGVLEDFFELGGHSLDATAVVVRIEDEFGVAVALRDFFIEPTVAAVAATLVSGTLSARLPVIAASRDLTVAASSAQERLLFIDRLAPGVPVYNLPVALRLRGAFDIDAFEWALTEVVRRHDALRTNFATGDTGTVQIVVDAAEVAVPVRVEDLRGYGQDGVDAALRAEAARPFDLQRDVKVRAMVGRTADDESVVVLTLHHIATDGWSTALVVQQLFELYAARVSGGVQPLGHTGLQYVDYSQWRRAVDESSDRAGGIDYWVRTLGGSLPVLDLPLDRPRPPVKSYNAGSVRFRLDADIAARISAASRANGVTPYVFMLASYLATMTRWSGQDDFVVGTATANRPRPELHDVVGLFVDMVAIRSAVDVDQPFASLLRTVREAALGAFAHEDVPFEQVVEAVSPPRDLSRSVIFQTVFMFNNLPVPEVSAPGLTIEAIDVDRSAVEYDIAVWLNEFADGIGGVVEFNADVFDAATVERLMTSWHVLLDAVLADPSIQVGDLTITTAAEREMLAGFGSPSVSGARARAQRLETAFAARALDSAGRVAVVHGDEVASYAEIDARANRLARRLLAAGVEPGARVGVAVERSVDMVVAVLAVLRCGSPYVPLDVGLPPARVRHMAADAEIGVVLVSSSALDGVLDPSVALVDVVADAEMIADLDPSPVSVDHGDDAGGGVAWVMFTSGSTGAPKGVEVEQASAVNFVSAMLDRPGLGPDDVVLAVPALTFDPSVMDLFVPAIVGARVVIADRDDVVDVRRLARLIESSGATAMQATPTVWSLLLDSGWTGAPGLRALCGGEAMPVDLARRLRAVCGSVWNLYGPTETTVWSTVHEVTDASLVGATVPVGRPIANLVYRVVDRRGRLVPIGVAGDIVIGGAGVARGYVGRAELTAERFVTDPVDGLRIYRSGDLGRWLPGGELEFLGRSDFQVKLRGNRIELGEIEVVLRGLDGVADAVVVADGSGAAMRLVAYLVATAGSETSSVGELRAGLQRHVPDYMLPAVFMWLDEFPLTTSRKIDRRALPAPVASAPAAGRVAPRTDAERVVAGIVADVLDLPTVGVEDDFFELGGHSLHAVAMLARVEAEFGVAPGLRDFFRHPTVEAIAADLDSGAMARIDAIGRADRSAPVPVSSAQRRLLFLDRLAGGSSMFNLAFPARLAPELDDDVLRASLRVVLARHESLRTNFDEIDGEWYQVVVDPDHAELPWTVVDVGPGDDVLALAQAETERLFDLRNDVKLRVRLLRDGDDRVLVMTMHHIAVDGWSVRRIIGEWVETYTAMLAGRAPALPDLPVQYLDYSVWQRERLAADAGAAGLEYWTANLGGVLPVLDLPTDHVRPRVQSFRSGALDLLVPNDLAADIRAASRANGVTPFVFMLAAYVATLSRWTGQDDFVVGTAAANRARPEVDNVVGMFVNTLALRTPVDFERPFTDLLAAVKETVIGAFAHEDVPFDRIVEAIKPPRDVSRSVVYQTMFVLNNMPLPKGLSFDDVDAEAVPIATGSIDVDVAVTVIELPVRTEVKVEFNADVLDEETVQRLMGHWLRFLVSAVADAGCVVADVDVLSGDERATLDRFASPARLPVDVPRPARLETAFADRALDAPDRVAVVHGDEALTYAEIDARANRLARRAIAAGVAPGARVGVAVERSVDMVVAVLAALRCGAAYVPLDAGLPAARLGHMVRDAGIHVVLVSSRALDGVFDASVELVDVVAGRAVIAALDSSPVSVGIGDEPGGGAAWVMFTSGSTGVPKGVEVEHASAVNFVTAMLDRPGVGSDDVVLAVPALTFDPSVMDLFVPAMVGARVVIADRDDVVDVRRLARLIESSGATVMQATPTTWTMLLDSGWSGAPGLTALCGGEAMPVDLARRLRAVCASVWNLYGPTETTVWSTVHEVTDASLMGATVPVGRPIAGLVYRVVDGRGRLLPLGAAGEIVIGGEGVARGYVGRPELTAERFVTDAVDGLRLYRSGDLGRWLPGGELEFLGRSDFQVKLRGNRVELGEIEAVLRGLDGVADAVVVADGSGAAMRLVAYLVATAGAETSSVGELRAGLQRRVPDYIVPSVFMWLDEFPLTPSRKIDRKAFPAPAGAAPTVGQVAPRTDVERVVAGIVADVLGLDTVGVEDDFFELGGHSLNATSVVAGVDAALGSTVDLRTFFARPTVAGLAEAMLADGGTRARVEKVARVRVQLAAMSPDEVAAALAARRAADKTEDP